MPFPTRIAEWNFEDVLTDSSGNSHTLAAVAGSAAVAYQAGQVGAGPRAWRSDHTTNWIQIGTDAANDLGKWFTVGKVGCIAFWFKPTITTLLYDIPVQTFTSGAANAENLVRLSSVTGSGESTANVTLGGPGAGTGATALGTRAALGTTFHHVMVVWSGVNWWRYFDGVLVASGSNASTSDVDGGATPELRVGPSTNSRNRHYVDQLLVFPYSDDHEYIANWLWNSGSGRTDLDTGYSPPDEESSGSSASSSSSSSNSSSSSSSIYADRGMFPGDSTWTARGPAVSSWASQGPGRATFTPRVTG